VCVYVCVRERERMETGGERGREGGSERGVKWNTMREGEIDQEVREGERETQNK
jgi:hypothetical protein